MSTIAAYGRAGLAVVGDGSAAHGDPAQDPSAVLTALGTDVRLLRDHAHLAAFPVAVTVREAGQLSAALRALPPGTTAIFLTRTEPGRARPAQQDLAGTSTVPVVTEQDTVGIALTAALLTTLRRAGVSPQSSRVVVTGPRTLPLLVPLLTAAGVGDLVSWNKADAAAFPLSGVARDATAVIDLIAAASALPPAFAADVPVLVADDPVGHLLALPGVLRALRETPATGFGADPLYRLDVHCACARALAALTPVDRMLPELSDPELTDAVAQAAAGALQPPTSTKNL